MINFDSLTTMKIYSPTLRRKFFKWYDMGILGVGVDSLPFIELDNLVELPSNSKDIVAEVNEKLNSISPNSGTGVCLVPEHINNHLMPSYYSYNADKFIRRDELFRIKTKYQV